MDEETLKALEGSIKKWYDIVYNNGEDQGPYNCPLCVKFFWRPDCRGCPVYKNTGKTACRGTPYVAWTVGTSPIANGNRKVVDEVSKQLAIKELEFLQSLLPKQEPQVFDFTKGWKDLKGL